MKQVAYALVLVTGLGGCQSVETVLNASVPNVVTQARVYQAHQAYNSAAVFFANYTSVRVGDSYVARPLCLKGQSYYRNGCAVRSVVLQIQNVNRRARITLAQLDQFEATHRGQATFEGVALLQAAAEIVNAAKLVAAEIQ